MLLTEHLSNPSTPFRRLCDQDIRALIESKARKDDDSAKSKTDPPPMLRQLKSHEIVEMEEAYKAGSSSTELAAKCGVDRTTVTRRLRLRGVEIRERASALSPNDAEEAAALYRQGWSLSQLAARYGTTSPTMSRTLKKAGVVIRPPTGG